MTTPCPIRQSVEDAIERGPREVRQLLDDLGIGDQIRIIAPPHTERPGKAQIVLWLGGIPDIQAPRQDGRPGVEGSHGTKWVARQIARMARIHKRQQQQRTA